MRRAGAAAVLVALALAAGCATTSGTPAQQVREWANGATFSSDNSTIEQDLASLALAVRDRSLIELHTVCEGFGADVQTLWGNLPTPDATLTNELNVALENDFENAAIVCYDAPSFSSAKYRTYERELAAGKVEYARAQLRLAHFGVR